MDERDWVTVHTYTNHMQADFAVSILRGSGIETLADNEYTSTAGIGDAGTEVHVMVLKEDAERAAEILAEMDTGEPAADEIEEEPAAEDELP